MSARSSDTFHSLLNRRLTRRALLCGSAGVLAYSAAPKSAWPETSSAPFGFKRVAASREDQVIVPADYRYDVVVRWGDALTSDGESLDAHRVAGGGLLERGAAAAQSRQFGFNCDGLGLFHLSAERWLMCVNHEFPSGDLMFPDWAAARRNRTRHELVRAHPEMVAYMQASVGVSVVELEYDGRWRYVKRSRFNRRITANTETQFAGPAKNHPLLGGDSSDTPARVFGTMNNCAAGSTPWGTYLTAEENTDDFFGNLEQAKVPAELARAYELFGARARESAYRWEFADARFDVARTPYEPLKFGWIVEIDPRDASQPIKKRTALGRFKHEAATTALTADGRVAAYMGDDEAFEHFYKFVTAERFDPTRPERNRDLLDAGTLYVAKLHEDGSGEWLPLVWNEHPELTPRQGFNSQADVVLYCREAAGRIGATPLDRPEDVAVSPIDGRVYLACTENLERTGAAPSGGRILTADVASPRVPNPRGHIIEFVESAGDAGATRFRWEVFMLAGDPLAGSLLRALPRTSDIPLKAETTYFAGQRDESELSGFANPDNLGFDGRGNLWIVTDGTQPGNNNDGCFVCATQGEWRGAARQFMSAPVGAEVCGCVLTPDDHTLFLTIQHPGEGGSLEELTSHWPDGDTAAPRSSLIAIYPEDATRKVGE